MRGAVAAGNRHTAEAGAWALAEGGGAVDAVVAATLVAFVAEGPLTGPAGAGFLIHHEHGHPPVVLDCFFAVPSNPYGTTDEVVIDFADASTQTFHVGEASVAVPGLLSGLAAAHERSGRLPWAHLAGPALELARRGVAPTEAQRFLHRILVPILQRDEGGRRMYADPDRIVTDDLVPTLERIRDAGAAALIDLLPELADDLTRYRPQLREPLDCRFRNQRVATTPSPSIGGAIVQRALALIDRDGTGGPAGSAGEAARLVAALTAGYGAAGGGARPTGTTHVSVIAADGGAAGLSSTLGSGAGVFRHGFQLNNMLGELDVIGTTPREAGERLPSMMCPTLVLDDDGDARLVVGSAGSVRLAGAIAQIVAGVVGQGLGVGQAIERPRIHVDGAIAHVEGGWSEDVGPTIAAAGFETVIWSGRNLFFGGASAVERRPDGTFAAAGDPRRGGRGVVVG